MHFCSARGVPGHRIYAPVLVVFEGVGNQLRYVRYLWHYVLRLQRIQRPRQRFDIQMGGVLYLAVPVPEMV